MVVKKKKVETRMFVPRSYVGHTSKPGTSDAFKTMMCKDMKDRFNLQKSIDKIEKSLKPSNSSIYRGKSSVRGLVKEYGAGLENNYYNFSKASVENPFSKYGVLLDDYKPKPRRKTNSAPSFLEFVEPFIQKIDTTLEEDKITRDTTGDADENLDKFPFSLDDIERRMSNTGYLSTSNPEHDFNLNDFSESYRKRLGLETTRGFKNNLIDLTKEYTSDYVSTSREYKTDFLLNADSFKVDTLFTNRTYKSDSEDSLRSSDFKPIKFEYNSVDEVMRRLYKCTKSVFFDRSHTRSSVREKKLEDDTSPAEEVAKRAILNQNPSRICSDLMERLETLVSSCHKRSSNYYSKYKCTCPDPITNSGIFSHSGRSHFDINSRLNSHDNHVKYSSNYYADSHSNTDYEETTLDVTPNKYTGCHDYEDDLLKVSTESARRAINRARGTRRSVQPYTPNDEFMLTDSEDYAFIDTKFGRIIYSPKLQDDKYMYRFVVLTNEAQKAVEILAKNSKSFSMGLSDSKRLLTESQIMQDLGIRMSRGWHHYFYFKNGQKELILRKRL